MPSAHPASLDNLTQCQGERIRLGGRLAFPIPIPVPILLKGRRTRRSGANRVLIGTYQRVTTDTPVSRLTHFTMGD